MLGLELQTIGLIALISLQTAPPSTGFAGVKVVFWRDNQSRIHGFIWYCVANTLQHTGCFASLKVAMEAYYSASSTALPMDAK